MGPLGKVWRGLRSFCEAEQGISHCDDFPVKDDLPNPDEPLLASIPEELLSDVLLVSDELRPSEDVSVPGNDELYASRSQLFYSLFTSHTDDTSTTSTYPKLRYVYMRVSRSACVAVARRQMSLPHVTGMMAGDLEVREHSRIFRNVEVRITCLSRGP